MELSNLSTNTGQQSKRGAGQLPLIYLSLPEQERRAVREEVRAGLSPFEKNGRLEMTVEMLIGVGRA